MHQTNEVAPAALNKREIQELNRSMLGLGAPIEKDDQGYNRPDFVRMERIGMILGELTDEEAFLVLETLQKYTGRQLKSMKEPIETSLSIYQKPEDVAEILAGEKRKKEDFGKRILGFRGVEDNQAIITFSEHMYGINIYDAKGKWRDEEFLVPVPYLRIFLDYIRDQGKFGYEPPKELLAVIETYEEENGTFTMDLPKVTITGIGECELNRNSSKLVSSLIEIVGNLIHKFDCRSDMMKIKVWWNKPEWFDFCQKEGFDTSQVSDELEKLMAKAQEETKKLASKATLTATGRINQYGYDLYELDLNEYTFTQQLWSCKGKGLSYIDSKSDPDKVFISTKDSMLPELIKFLKNAGIDTSQVEKREEIDRNASGNHLLDISGLKLPFKPYAFQLEDAEKIVSRKKAILGHDMGLGKTFISALVGMSIPGKKLVICPETLRLNWQRELEQTDGVNHHADIRIVYSKDKSPVFGQDWTIMGYKTAVKYKDLILKENFVCLFVDEAHKCKAVNNYGRPASKQAEAIMTISGKTEYTYLLTGTPMPTRNKDLYNPFIMLGEIRDEKYAFYRFGMRYCDGQKTDFGMDFSGSSNTDELHEKLGQYMIRRLKTTELPHLTKQRIPIWVNEPLSRDYTDIEKKLKEVNDENTFMALAMTGRRHLAKCKIKSAIEFAENLLDADESVVLVTEFDEALDEMLAYYGDKACCIRGGMSDREKQMSIDAFQSGEKRVCCINLIAGGVGITLTRAHNMIICDFDWTPANMAQVEDRICRSGQKEPCNIFYICHYKALFDHIFMEIITAKSENIDRVVDDAENTVDMIAMKHKGGLSEFMRMLKKR